MKNAIVSLVVSFILGRVKKFGKDINWQKVKADLDIRIRTLIPGEMFDDAACAIANGVVDAAAEFFTCEKIDEVVNHMIAGEWNAAFEDVLAFVKAKVGF